MTMSATTTATRKLKTDPVDMVWNTMDTGPQELKEDEEDGEAEQKHGVCGG